MKETTYNPETGEINVKNKVLNPVVHRWNVWKQDRWAILNAAQNERQRLMQEVAEKQKVIKQLTEIMEQHNNRAES